MAVDMFRCWDGQEGDHEIRKMKHNLDERKPQLQLCKQSKCSVQLSLIVALNTLICTKHSYYSQSFLLHGEIYGSWFSPSHDEQFVCFCLYARNIHELSLFWLDNALAGNKQRMVVLAPPPHLVHTCLFTFEVNSGKYYKIKTGLEFQDLCMALLSCFHNAYSELL